MEKSIHRRSRGQNSKKILISLEGLHIKYDDSFDMDDILAIFFCYTSDCIYKKIQM